MSLLHPNEFGRKGTQLLAYERVYNVPEPLNLDFHVPGENGKIHFARDLHRGILFQPPRAEL